LAFTGADVAGNATISSDLQPENRSIWGTPIMLGTLGASIRSAVCGILARSSRSPGESLSRLTVVSARFRPRALQDSIMRIEQEDG